MVPSPVQYGPLHVQVNEAAEVFVHDCLGMIVVLIARGCISGTFVNDSTVIDLGIIGLVTGAAVVSVCTIETICARRIGFTTVADTSYCGFVAFIDVNTDVEHDNSTFVFLMFVSGITYTFSGNAMGTFDTSGVNTTVGSGSNERSPERTRG